MTPTPKKTRRLAAAAAGTLLISAMSLGAVSPAFAASTPAEGSSPATISPRDEAGLRGQQEKIAEFHGLINQLRAENGVHPLTFNSRAAADAYDWSIELSKIDYLQHQDGPDDFLEDWGGWGENIAYAYSDSAANMFELWKNSPGHLENMLSENFDTYGIGFYTDDKGRTTGTTVFYGVGWRLDTLPDSYTNPADYFAGEPALPTRNPEPEPTPDPTPTPEPEPTPDPTPTPEPEPEPTPDPTPTPEPEPTPDPEPSPAAPFSDVSPDHSFYTPITWMRDAGVTTGYVDGTYRAGKDITRGEAASFLYRISGDDHVPSDDSRFEDVGPTSSHATAIDWMAENGYSLGYTDGTFRPGHEITRAELASLAYRVSGAVHEVAEDYPFDDVSTSSAHYEAISWLNAQGGADGYTDGTFRPGRDITRGETAKMLYTLR